MTRPEQTVRLGKIGYLNILPVYHPLESGVIANSFEIVSGPPAKLNRLMASGGLHISSMSSIEYARRPENYVLIPNLAIGSRGPVGSVMLLSREPVTDLDGKTILVSSQTHTSAALLRVLMREYLRLDVNYETGDATSMLGQDLRPDAILAIGDECLTLRSHPDYPYTMDLGDAWLQWTGLPFIFGVWAMSRDYYQECLADKTRPWELLVRAKDWGKANMEAIITLASATRILPMSAMRTYYQGLVYDLGPHEQRGLRSFYRRLVTIGEIEEEPELVFAGELGGKSL